MTTSASYCSRRCRLSILPTSGTWTSYPMSALRTVSTVRVWVGHGEKQLVAFPPAGLKELAGNVACQGTWSQNAQRKVIPAQPACFLLLTSKGSSLLVEGKRLCSRDLLRLTDPKAADNLQHVNQTVSAGNGVLLVVAIDWSVSAHSMHVRMKPDCRVVKK